MFGLLYLLNHWCMLGIKEIPPANKTCTSVPQEWHKPRGDSIEPEPVVKCSFSKASSDKDGKRKLHPVTCPGGGGGGVLPYKRLLGMCRWMGSHFHDWTDYNGVAFLVELLEWDRTFSGFLG